MILLQMIRLEPTNTRRRLKPILFFRYEAIVRAPDWLDVILKIPAVIKCGSTNCWVLHNANWWHLRHMMDIINTIYVSRNHFNVNIYRQSNLCCSEAFRSPWSGELPTSIDWWLYGTSAQKGYSIVCHSKLLIINKELDRRVKEIVANYDKP